MKDALYNDLPDALKSNLNNLYQVSSEFRDSNLKLNSPIFEEFESLENRFSEKEFHASGGMKKVCRVTDLKTSRKIAMAELKNDMDSELNVAQFLREGRITATLEHPNIVPVYDIGLNEFGKPYFTMKFLKDQSLKKILRELAKQNPVYTQKYPLDVMLDIFQKICEAVAYAHSRGIIHLDIKPENIMIGDYGEVYLCDWGLAKLLDTPEITDKSALKLDPDQLNSITLSGEIKGTPGFMAPEQIETKLAPKNKQTDIYGLGALLYSILTYKRPFAGEKNKDILFHTLKTVPASPSQISYHHNLPVSLDAICLKAMAKKPINRYKSVDLLVKDFRSYNAGFATQAEEISFGKSFKLLVKRHKLAAILTISLSFLLLVTCSIFFHIINKNKREAQNLLSIKEKQLKTVIETGKSRILALKDSGQLLKDKLGKQKKFTDLLLNNPAFVTQSPVIYPQNPDSIQSQVVKRVPVSVKHPGFEGNALSLKLGYNFHTGINLEKYFTICFWLKIDNIRTTRPMKMITDQGGENKINLEISSFSSVDLNCFFNHNDQIKSKLKSKKWLHIGLVHNKSNQLQLFINGKPVAEKSTKLPDQSLGMLKFIDFHSWVDELRIWSAPLTAEEISQESSTIYPKQENLTNWYKFDLNSQFLVNFANIPHAHTKYISERVKLSESPSGAGNKALFLHETNQFNSRIELAESFTISYWLEAPKTLSNKSMQLFTVEKRSFNINFHVNADGSTSFSNYPDAINTAKTEAGSIKPGQWNHITLIYSNTSRKLQTFINGSLSGEKTSNIMNIHYGSLGLANFDTEIDELRIWGKVLSEEEVIENMKSLSPDRDNLKGWYSFDGNGSIYLDSSGNKNHVFKGL